MHLGLGLTKPISVWFQSQWGHTTPVLNGFLVSKETAGVIQHLSTRLIKPNFCFDLPHRRSTIVSFETRNPFTTQPLRPRSSLATL